MGGDPAASGEARSTKYSESSSASWMDDRNAGVTDRQRVIFRG
ncbi:hypothetical protein [Actinoplanes xinjiangensis]|nr:hypothetical protein [Actinoplanes xinjiangensis]